MTVTKEGHRPQEDAPIRCRECGMHLWSFDEYHPVGACMMYKACRDSKKAQDTLKTVQIPDEGTQAFEYLAESVHDAWWNEKIKQGGADTHPDAIPYEQLSESVKEYDRATVRTVLHALVECTPGAK